MIKLIQRLLFVAILYSISSLHAAVMPRIDIQGIKGKVEFKDLKVFGSNKAGIILARWKWIKGDSCAVATFRGLKTKTWTLIGLQFTPKTSGKVKLMLMANRNNYAEGVAYYDNLAIKGAELLNTDFEEVDPSRKLPFQWHLMNLRKNREKLATYSSEFKKSGKVSALVYYESRLVQNFTVEKGKPVTIEVWVYIP